MSRVVLAVLTPAPELVDDALGYDAAARRLVNDGYFAYVDPDTSIDAPHPNAIVMPGYPAFLAAVYAVAGPSVPAQPLMSLVQALLSGLTLFGVFALARRIAGPLAGLAALGLCAGYPPMWWSYRYVLTEDVTAALCVWSAWAVLRAADPTERRLRPGAWAAAGLLAAAAIYVRPTVGAWVLLAGLVLIARHPDRGRVVRGGLVLATVVVVCFVPWWFRNAAIYGTFVPLSTKGAAAGAVLSLYDDADAGAQAIEPFGVSYTDPAEELRADAGLSELSARLHRDALRSDPVGLVWRKTRYALIAISTYHPNPFGGFGGWGAVVEAAHLLLLAMAARGSVLGRRHAGVWVLLALPVALLLVHAPTLIYSRYLFPMMPFAAVLAGLGVQPRATVPHTPQPDAASATGCRLGR